MPKTILLLISVWLISLNAQEIKFAPLPKEKAETLQRDYAPFLEWLAKKQAINILLQSLWTTKT